MAVDDVVSVVQKYAAIAAETTSSNVNSTGNNDNNANTPNAASNNDGDEDMEAIMQSIGIVSPVTKYSAGRLYHQQLARQVSDILIQHDRLRKLGGMITLIDLYCLYNKARGTELVSPDDLLAACKLCQSMSLPLKLKTFPNSGVVVMELVDLDYHIMVDKILALAKQKYSSGTTENKGLLPSQVAASLKMSLMITNEILLYAENVGVICRDSSDLHGVAYYPNMFPEYCKQLRGF